MTGSRAKSIRDNQVGFFGVCESLRRGVTRRFMLMIAHDHIREMNDSCSRYVGLEFAFNELLIDLCVRSAATR